MKKKTELKKVELKGHEPFGEHLYQLGSGYGVAHTVRAPALTVLLNRHVLSHVSSFPLDNALENSTLSDGVGFDTKIDS